MAQTEGSNCRVLARCYSHGLHATSDYFEGICEGLCEETGNGAALDLFHGGRLVTCQILYPTFRLFIESKGNSSVREYTKERGCNSSVQTNETLPCLEYEEKRNELVCVRRSSQSLRACRAIVLLLME